MLYNTARKFSEENYMDWQIASTKAAVCVRRYRCTHDDKFLVLAEKHLKTANGFLEEVDRRADAIADPLEYVGAFRVC